MLSKLLQVIIDVLIGIAIYYCMILFTNWDQNIIFILSLTVTAIFAELVEVVWRKK